MDKQPVPWDINECSPTCHLIAGHIGAHQDQDTRPEWVKRAEANALVAKELA